MQARTPHRENVKSLAPLLGALLSQAASPSISIPPSTCLCTTRPAGDAHPRHCRRRTTGRAVLRARSILYVSTHTPPAAFTSCYYYTTRRTKYAHLSIPSFVLCNACASRAFLHPVPLINSRALGSLLASRMPRSKPWRAAGTAMTVAAASCSSRCARHAVDAK
jgi:hypothetical protein